jgi:hypothetical protein
MDDQKPVVWVSHSDDEKCAACGLELMRGDIVHLNRQLGVRCVKCAGFGDLVYLPSGDPALTRRATAGSARHAVVVKFSRARKRNERQGTLVEEAALAAAKESCARDAKKREAIGEKRRAQAVVEDAEYRREFERRILDLFPSCPASEARAIAEHACRKHSGRVGRTAAAKSFDPKMIELAVRARIRHEHTEYDEILAQEFDKRGARAEVRDRIDEVCDKWREPAAQPGRGP